jgi:hypothetical protein
LKDRAELNAPKVRYPQRGVLGFTAADAQVIRNSWPACFENNKSPEKMTFIDIHPKQLSSMPMFRQKQNPMTLNTRDHC